MMKDRTFLEMDRKKKAKEWKTWSSYRTPASPYLSGSPTFSTLKEERTSQKVDGQWRFGSGKEKGKGGEKGKYVSESKDK